MDVRSNIADSFSLIHMDEVSQRYRKIPAGTSNIFYHYTTRTGLEGILRSGGLRATYRLKMNDYREFKYASDLVFYTLSEVEICHDLPPATQRMVTYVRKNLNKFLKYTAQKSYAYCACLTVSLDSPSQWKTYADNGNGFAIGLNLYHILKDQIATKMKAEPFVFCSPVIYNKQIQRSLVRDLVHVGIRDFLTFAENCSICALDLTALRDRITQEIVVQLLVHTNFIKAPIYNGEGEMRLFLEPNNGTLEASDIQYFKRDNESIPFIFMSLRNPITNRLPLTEIKVGLNAEFAEQKRFLECLLDELGYGSNFSDRPQITRSKSGVFD